MNLLLLFALNLKPVYIINVIKCELFRLDVFVVKLDIEGNKSLKK